MAELIVVVLASAVLVTWLMGTWFMGWHHMLFSEALLSDTPVTDTPTWSYTTLALSCLMSSFWGLAVGIDLLAGRRDRRITLIRRRATYGQVFLGQITRKHAYDYLIANGHSVDEAQFVYKIGPQDR